MRKWAVAIGGGTNHRFGLYDMIMLKDNHIDYNGSISNAVKMAREYVEKNKLNLKIEVETRNLKEVQEAINTPGIDRIMLDNMDNETMAEAVILLTKFVKPRLLATLQEKDLRILQNRRRLYLSRCINPFR